jgi:arylsulfatase A-like enzyme
MTIKLKPQTCLYVLLSAIVSFQTPQRLIAAEPQRPNIVFMYADDWRWDCLGEYQRDLGDKGRFPWLETPRLDKLAKESVRFDQSFVVNSLCSPGRTCVLTSEYSHLNGIIGNSKPLPVDTLTFPKLLQQAGYTTAYCGKWHLDNQRERPGFDFVASFVGQGKYNDCPIMLNGNETPTHGWIDDITTGYAIQFLDEQRNKDKPFFLWLGFKSPHGPRGGENLPERARGLYAGKESRDVPNLDVPAIFERDKVPPTNAEKRQAKQYEGHRAYMRHITMIDECVGRVLDALEKNSQAENTVVIVSSDNGYYLGEHMLSDKRSAYDESMRVPLIVHMPGKDTKHAVNKDAMVLNIDYGPTILDLAGARPLSEGQGRSLRPLLTGDTPKDWRPAFFYEYFKEPNYTSPTVLAVRTNTSKLITYPGHDEWTEVFDLRNDPFELKNLAGDGELLKKMRTEFDAEATAVKFKMPKLPSSEGKSGAEKDRSPAADGG